MDDEYGAVCGMIGKGNRSTRRKLSPVVLCPPQIPHDLTRARTQAAVVGSRRLTAWATARPQCKLESNMTSAFHEQKRCYTFHVSLSLFTDAVTLTSVKKYSLCWDGIQKRRLSLLANCQLIRKVRLIFIKAEMSYFLQITQYQKHYNNVSGE
jgi:hypothetical protein